MRPARLRIGAPLSSIGRSVPSAAIRVVWLARPTMTPSASTRVTGLSTGRRLSSLTILNTSAQGRLRAWSSFQPVRCSAIGFMNATRPWTSVAMTASPMLSSVVSNHSRCSASASSARRSSVTSRNTRTAPTVSPSPSRIGAALSAIGRSLPSRCRSTVWFARPTVCPVRITRSTGLSTTCRLFSLMIRNTSTSGRPAASPAAQPVNSSAHGFMNVTRPSLSDAITPSPMLLRVTRKYSCCAASSRARRFCSVMSRATFAMPMTFPASSWIGETDREMSSLRPPLATRTVSMCSTRPPARTFSRSMSSSS